MSDPNTSSTQPVQPGASTGAAHAAQPSAEAGTTSKEPWYKRRWVIPAAALLLGIILGSASAGEADPKESPEYQALNTELEDSQAELQSTEDELSSAQDELSATQGELASTETERDEIAGGLPAREDAVKEAEAALDQREEALSKEEADLRKASAAVARRERAVGTVEKEIASNTIPGDGVYQVGVDMQPGLYKTPGAADCYYAVLGDPNGNDIKSNNIVSGPSTVTVAAGEYFETQGCADWVLQQ